MPNIENQSNFFLHGDREIERITSGQLLESLKNFGVDVKLFDPESANFADFFVLRNQEKIVIRSNNEVLGFSAKFTLFKNPLIRLNYKADINIQLNDFRFTTKNNICNINYPYSISKIITDNNGCKNMIGFVSKNSNEILFLKEDSTIQTLAKEIFNF